MVEGVTKLGQISGAGRRAPTWATSSIQAENLRKMFLAMAQDLRVVIIKLADRLHNMRTLCALEPDDQQRIAHETMEIYAPLAARLGIWEIKWQLEDLAFRYLEPETYKQVAEMLDAKRERRARRTSTEVTKLLRQELDKARHQGRGPGPRQAHLQHLPEDGEVRRRTAAASTRSTTCSRCACSSRRSPTATRRSASCTACGGRCPGAFDDYIANPKESMYQSLHTTVMALKAPAARGADPHARDAPHRRVRHRRALALQGRRQARRPLRGAPRLAAPAPGLAARDRRRRKSWSRPSRPTSSRTRSSSSRPRARSRTCRPDSTPLDFAYRIHTDLGHRCVGAKVNGRLVAAELPAQERRRGRDPDQQVVARALRATG